jgi:hypothetical protein
MLLRHWTFFIWLNYILVYTALLDLGGIMNQQKLIHVVLLLFIAFTLAGCNTSAVQPESESTTENLSSESKEEQTVNGNVQSTKQTEQIEKESKSQSQNDASQALINTLQTSEAVYLTAEHEEHEDFSKLVLMPNGGFVFLDRLPKGMGKYLGTYTINGDYITLNVNLIPTPFTNEISEIHFTIISVEELSLNTDVNEAKVGKMYYSVKK